MPNGPPGNEQWGPLLYLTNESVALAPLLRTREYTAGGALKLSWTAYQPHALLWGLCFLWRKEIIFAIMSACPKIRKSPSFLGLAIVPGAFPSGLEEFFSSYRCTKVEVVYQGRTY